MNKYYQADIIKRFMTREEFVIFDKEYRENRIPKPYSRWGTREERKEFLTWLERRKGVIRYAKKRSTRNEG